MRFAFGRRLHFRGCGSGDEAVVQRFAPSLFVAPGAVTNDVVRPLVLVAREERQNFRGRPSAIKRLYQRLLDRRRAIESACVAPGFQIVRLRQVPLCENAGLVPLHAQVNGRRDLLDSRAEGEIGRSIVSWIAAQDDQRLDAAGGDVGSQLLQRGDLRPALGLHIRDCLARVAERMVDPVRGGVNRCRLARACDHQRPAAILLEVARERGQPLSPRIAIQYGEPGGQQTERAGQVRRELLDLASAQAEPVVGHRAGHRELALHNVEPVHRVLLGSDVAAGREVPGVGDRGRIERQKVRVQRQDHIRLVEMVERPDEAAESQFRASENLVFRNRLVLDPLRLREAAQRVRSDRFEGRAVHRLTQEAHPLARRPAE